MYFLYISRYRTKSKDTTSKTIRNTKVLIVDDYQFSREMLQDILQSFTFEVDSVSSGRAAVAAVRMAIMEDHPYELKFIRLRNAKSGFGTGTGHSTKPATRLPHTL